jgi:hypothetical protein
MTRNHAFSALKRAFSICAGDRYSFSVLAFRPRFIDRHCTALQLGTVQPGNGIRRFVVVSYLNKGKATRLPSLISDYFYRIHFAVGHERGAERVLGDFARKIPNVDVLHDNPLRFRQPARGNTFRPSEPF